MQQQQEDGLLRHQEQDLAGEGEGEGEERPPSPHAGVSGDRAELGLVVGVILKITERKRMTNYLTRTQTHADMFQTGQQGEGEDGEQVRLQIMFPRTEGLEMTEGLEWTEGLEGTERMMSQLLRRSGKDM